MKKFLTILLVTTLILTFSVGVTVLAETVVTAPEVQETVTERILTIDLTKIIEAALTILMGIVAYYVIPLLKDKRIRALVKTAYYAAEQLYNIGEIDDKLAYAEEWLKKKGIKVDTRALMEAFCGEVNQYKEDLELQYFARAAYDEGYFYGDEDEDFDDDEYDDEDSDDVPMNDSSMLDGEDACTNCNIDPTDTDE